MYNHEEEELKNVLKSKLPEYVEKITTADPKAGKNMYACPLCGSGTHDHYGSDGAFHVSPDNNTWYCHACGKGGDIFSLIKYHEGIDNFRDQLKFGADFFNLPADFLDRPSAIEDFSDPVPVSKKKEPVTAADQSMNAARLSLIEKYAAQLPSSPGEKYLHDRGLNDSTIKYFKLGYNPSRLIPVTGEVYATVSIPFPGTDYFTERLIGYEGKGKYQNQKGSAPLFEIHESGDGFLFITEGMIDAISMYQVGAKNVLACHYPSKLESWLKDNHPSGAVIVADRDAPGENFAKQTSEILKKHKINNVIVTPPEGFKDSNDLLKADPKKLRNFLDDAIRTFEISGKTHLKEISVKEYINSGELEEDRLYFAKYKNRKTGFPAIDKYLTLYPGLACITGATSLGKTSFVVQLCDQLVSRGETILYFTLEQDYFDITNKMIARRYYQQADRLNFNNTTMQGDAKDDTLLRVTREVAEQGARFIIIEADFRTTADDICQYVTDYMKKTGIKPVFVVDYLQILGAPDELIGRDERAKTDDAIKKLKLMQRNNELFGICISNMARSDYNDRIDESCFKESGLVEYTCDYLFGLQLSLLESDGFFFKLGPKGGKQKRDQSEQTEMIYEASAKMPKDVVFKCMKQRKGKKVFKAFFKYHPDYDYFETDDNSPYDKDSPRNAFRPIDFDEEIEDADRIV